jgi:hypothetical protein
MAPPPTHGGGVVRALVFPLSFLLLGLGFLGILVQREHRALHDLIAGSAVIYAWDARAARLRFLAREAEVAAGTSSPLPPGGPGTSTPLPPGAAGSNGRAAAAGNPAADLTARPSATGDPPRPPERDS